ncbi:MAG: TraB/GumN family protein [Flavobacteriales bacterium]|nr:TraB/GumN family protein [Flavobacteriales bacterium]MDW8409604.1 TraB/GumN family protein [Flavobacteriales bacterium]
MGLKNPLPEKLKPNTGLLWKVQGAGLSQPSFLFGTIHMIPARDFFFSRAADSVFRLCRTLVMEMDISDPTLQMKVLKAMQMDSGITLSSLFRRGQYKKLQKRVGKFGFTMEMFEKFMPIVVQQNFILRHTMGSEVKSYELHLLGLARQMEMEVVGLEEVQEQVKALRSIPLPEQAEMLKKSILRPATARRELFKFIRYYREGEIEKLLKFSNSKKSLRNSLESLLYERNRRWIPRLKGLMTKNSVFVAVGAAHLAGPQGLIALLRQDGYTVEAIPSF